MWYEGEQEVHSDSQGSDSGRSNREGLRRASWVDRGGCPSALAAGLRSESSGTWKLSPTLVGMAGRLTSQLWLPQGRSDFVSKRVVEGPEDV